MNTTKGKLLVPLIVSIIALLVLVSFNPMASQTTEAKPDISTNDQTIWIYQGHRLLYHGPGNANNDSFALGTFTQDANEPISYNATIYQPDWNIDGTGLVPGLTHTLDLSPGNYSYSDMRAGPPLLGYVNLETGLRYTISWNITTVSPPSPHINAPETIDKGTPVQFQGSATDGIGSEYNYSWNFGNGITSSLQDPTVTFNHKGTYEVNLTASDYTGGYGNTTINVTVGAPPSVSYTPHTTTLKPLKNSTASLLNVNQDYFNARETTGSIHHAWIDFSEHITTYNGTLNAYNGGEFAFLPGFYNGASFYYTIGTVYANISYGNHALNWSHAFNVLTTAPTTSEPNYYSIAPIWKLSGAYSGNINFNITITSYPGKPFSGYGNIPAGFVTRSVNGNGSYGQTNLSWTGSSSSSPIPFTHGYTWALNTSYFGSLNESYYIHWNSTHPTTSIYNGSYENGTSGEFHGTSYEAISFNSENTTSDVFPYNVTWITEPYPTMNITSGSNPTDVNVKTGFYSHTKGAGPFTYLWYVDGTSVSNSQDLTYEFSDSGSYNVSLEATDQYGNSVNASMTEYVNSGPSVKATASYYYVDVGVSDHFYANESGGTPPVSYNWTINGQSFHTQNVSYSFSKVGNYTVEVSVLDAADGTSYSLIHIRANNSPSVKITPNKAIASIRTEFESLSENGTGQVHLTWEFASGSTTGKYANYTFTNAGTQEIIIHATDQGGFSGNFYYNITVQIYVKISASSVQGIAPLKVNFLSSVLGGSSYSYTWNFGNGKLSVSAVPSETFASGNYTVNLTVTDQGGAEGYSDIAIESLPAPVGLSYSPDSSVTVLTQVEFNASPAWYAQNSSIVWNLPNGNQYSTFGFNYTFPTYSAINNLTVDFSYNFNGAKTYKTNLVVRMVPSLPVIQVSGYKSNVLVNSSITLDASGSFSYDSSIKEYRWSYDNVTYGQSSQAFTFRHTGTKDITIKVIDELGAESSQTLVVKVSAPTTSNDIAISVQESNTSSSIMFNVSAHSKYPVQNVEAVLSGPDAAGNTYFLDYTGGSGDTSQWTLTLNEYNFTSGTYKIEFVAFSNESSNYTNSDFSISPAISSGGSGGFTGLGYFVTAVGGPTSFLTLMGVIISAITVIVALKQRGTQVVEIGGDEYESRPGGDLKRVKQGKV